ncbi:MAG: ATP-dependent helicase/nuclease subunit A [Rhodothermales bacterium]|jgi:ATP-dependent helicase/nuclease subunit A
MSMTDSSQDTKVVPPDEAARKIIRGVDGLPHPISQDQDLVLDRNMVVRAGAGSGKTRSLVDRLVALVRSGVSAREIAAITFTIKAAGELRVRFAKALRDAANEIELRTAQSTGEVQEAWQLELTRLRQAEHLLEHVFIGTVHAFCGRLLRERPFEAGLSPDFEHIDPGSVMAHRRRFWNGFVARSADRWITRFEEVDLDPGDLFDFFSDCANNEDVPLGGLTLRPPMPDLRPAVSEIQDLVDEVVTRTALSPGEGDLLKEFRSLHRYAERESLNNAPALARFLHRARKLATKKPTLNRWGMRGSDLYLYAKEIKESIAGTVERVVDPPLSEWRDYVFFDAGQFVQEAVTEYSTTRRRRGEQSFDDLLWGARRMLERSADNRTHFARKFSRILIDEFQDTDPVQAEILLFLSSTNRHETNPWKCEPAPGSLFIVGDDKQSIYRFRRADVDVFHRFEQVLTEHGGLPVSLTTNFRSEPRLCGFVNYALQPAFSDPLKPAGQAEWEDVVAYEGNEARSHPEPVIRIAIPEKTKKIRSSIAAAEGPLVAQAIASLVRGGALKLEDGRKVDLAGPVGFKDVMVLFRTATYIPVFVQALNRLSIPYSISGGKTLGKVESLKLLLDPLDAVLKHDSVAQLAFLRGAFCGVSDTELMAFVEAGGTLRMPARGDGMLEPEPALAHGLQMIDDLTNRLLGKAPAEAICGWVEDHGILAGLALREGGAGLAGSLIRILALVRSWDARGMSWPEVVEELHRLEDAEIEAEQLTLDALSGEAVQLMTVHQAKGLEAKVVILADPHWGRAPDNDLYIDRSGKEATLAAQVKNRGRDIIAWTPGWKERAVRDLELQEAEELRLAYVAGTRAEELLLVSFYPRAEGPWSPFDHAIFEAPAFIGSTGGDVDQPSGPAVQGRLGLPPAGEDNELSTLVAQAEREAAESDARRAAVRLPSYLEVSASEDADEAMFFASAGEGRGRSYGNLVHRLFESLVRNRHKSLERSWVERVAARHAADTIQTAERAVRTKEATRAAAAFTTSAMWEAVQSADEVHAELPYTFAEPAAGDALTAVHAGVIDLAYRVGDVWHVVDYKTDALSLEDLALKHGSQVGEYAEALTRLAGATEVNCVIWSTSNGRAIVVAADAAAE